MTIHSRTGIMKQRTILISLSGIFVFSVILLVKFLLPEADKDISELTDYRKIEQKLAEQLVELPPDSKEAHLTANLYERVHLKGKGKTSRTDTPGEFLSALREIKRAFDGTEYESNYRTKELEKARRNKKLLKGSSVDEELNWVERGPGNCSGRTQQLVVDSSDPTHSTWFAATVGGGVWKTTNSGNSWSNCTPDLSTLSTTTIDIARSNPDVIYVGTGMGFGRVVDLAGSGIWKSTDHGNTWFQLQSTANNELYAAINRLVVSPDDENLVVACSNNDYTSYGPNGGSRESGIFRTSDGGVTWTKVFDPDAVFGTVTDNRVQHIVANPDNFNILYASVNEVGVVKSTNAGLTWSVSADNFADERYVGAFEGTYQGISTRIELAVAPSDPNRVYAAVERAQGVSQLYMTKDAGVIWVNVSDEGNNPNWFSGSGASGATGAYCAGWFDNTIAVSPYDENIVYVGGVEIYRINVNPTSNTRTTTEIAGTNVVHADHHDLDIIPVNRNTDEYIIINCNDGGIAVSTDKGNTWTSHAGLNSTQFYGVDKAPGFNSYIGGQQDNGTWVSGSDPQSNSNWVHVIGGDGFEAAWNFGNPNYLIGGSQSSNLSRSTDGGATWNSSHSGTNFGAAPFITKIASSDLDPDLIFAVVQGAIRRSDDFGASWYTININENWIGYRAFDNVEISLADPQVVWITSPLDVKPWIGKRGGIHVSTDGGLTYSEVSQNFPATVLESSGFATNPFNVQTAYALFSAAGTPKILKTTDLGQSWTDISGFSTPAGRLNKTVTSENESSNGFPDVATYCLLVMPFDENILWAGTEIGLFISENGGATWSMADNGLPKVGIFQMIIQDAQLIVATYGRGVWTVDLPELQSYILPEVTLAPRMTKLYQATSGDVVMEYNLRSFYDSTKIYMNDQLYEILPANNTVDNFSYTWQVYEEQTINMRLVSYKNGKQYKSTEKSIVATPVLTRYNYVNNFNSEISSDDFTGDGFSVRSYTGFSTSAIHSNHRYTNGGNFTYQLKIPIIVASSNAILSYDDIALIEPGTSSNYLNSNFFDYVIVEATSDGSNWLPLLNGYDAGYDDTWLQVYNSSIVGYDSHSSADESMFRNHTINLLDKFNPGDRIYIRFRLYSDALANAWGWVIDNLKIQPDVTDIGENDLLPSEFVLLQNYPNPFNPTTTINYLLPEKSEVKVFIYNSVGELVEKLVDNFQDAGNYRVKWNASELASGVYFGRIIAINNKMNFSKTIKMLLVK